MGRASEELQVWAVERGDGDGMAARWRAGGRSGIGDDSQLLDRGGAAVRGGGLSASEETLR